MKLCLFSYFICQSISRFHLTPRTLTISVWLSLSFGGIWFRNRELFETNFVNQNPPVSRKFFISRRRLLLLHVIDVVTQVKWFSDGFEVYWDLLTLLFGTMVKNVYCAQMRAVCSKDESGKLVLLNLIVY